MAHSPRRSAQQWESLIEQWQQSSQSAVEFCRQQGIGYASFCAWRRRLTQETASHPRASSASSASFIDLSALATPLAGGTGWHIVLRLGQGIELRLSQG